MCSSGFLQLMNRIQNTGTRSIILPYSATCFPGSKIGVRPDGTFHCCERINQSFPIGNVETGLDIDLIENLVFQYRNQVCSECSSCPITRLCPICFAILSAGNGDFKKDPPDICQKHLEKTRQEFSILWTLFEDGVPEQAIIGDNYSKDNGTYWE